MIKVFHLLNGGVRKAIVPPPPATFRPHDRQRLKLSKQKNKTKKIRHAILSFALRYQFVENAVWVSQVLGKNPLFQNCLVDINQWANTQL